MTQQIMSLMDVLAPPGNRWLMELSHCRNRLPAGVHIVRFYENDDEMADGNEDEGKKADRRSTMPV
jgi:hypothetical protein